TTPSRFSLSSRRTPIANHTTRAAMPISNAPNPTWTQGIGLDSVAGEAAYPAREAVGAPAAEDDAWNTVVVAGVASAGACTSGVRRSHGARSDATRARGRPEYT